MTYQVKIDENNLIPIPDLLCEELGLQVGDIMLCEAVISSSEIVMTKHRDQTLNDAEIASAGSLTRVIFLPEGLLQ